MFLPPLLIGEDEDGNVDFVSTSNTSIKYPKFANKNAMEYSHLKHFKELLDTQLPELSFTAPIRAKSDPPDFYINRSGKKIGLELTMLIFRDLRQEVKFFAKIQERLLDKYSHGKLKKLEGIEIDIEFSNHVNRPAVIGENILQELIASLNKLADKPFEFSKRMTDNDIPYPLSETDSVGNKLITWTVTHLGSIEPKTELGKRAGFEIGHSIKQYLKVDFINLLNKTIEAKDIEKNAGNELLISAGMPDIDGWITTIEAIGVSTFFEEWLKNFKGPKFLSNIYLDQWGQNKIYILYKS
ncbi:hypothetical protein ACIDE9_06140 [Methylophilus sp. 'Pure River']|uniref:hypothetical protein n=1 Tax=Methylophilus sp. 'Pure River' TaxID=3377117 RepID=UPI00398EA257